MKTQENKPTESLFVRHSFNPKTGKASFEIQNIKTGELSPRRPQASGSVPVVAYLSILDTVKLLHEAGNDDTVIYSNDRAAVDWYNGYGNNSKINPKKYEKAYLKMMDLEDWKFFNHPKIQVKWCRDPFK